jgi:hypothetical protein
MIEHNAAGIRYLAYGLFDPFVKVTNVVTTRHRGSSRPPFDTLNLGLHVGDDTDAVLENRAIVAQVLLFEPEEWTLGEQVHGSAVAVVRAGDKGRGAVVMDDAVGQADALVTNEPGIPLGVLVADCVAVSLYDPARHVAAIAHAGWKGTLSRVVEKTVDAMSNVFGTDPADIVAGLSPAVGKCHYAVGREVVDAFVDEFGYDAGRFLEEDPEGQWRLDLTGANTHQCRRAGIREGRFEVAGRCTACEPRLFYSHRRDGPRTGRFASIIMLHSTGRRAY